MDTEGLPSTMWSLEGETKYLCGCLGFCIEKNRAATTKLYNIIKFY